MSRGSILGFLFSMNSLLSVRSSGRNLRIGWADFADFLHTARVQIFRNTDRARFLNFAPPPPIWGGGRGEIAKIFVFQQISIKFGTI